MYIVIYGRRAIENSIFCDLSYLLYYTVVRILPEKELLITATNV